MIEIDEETIEASLELAGRAGADGIEVGYLENDAPIHKARWYAYAKYQGGRIICDEETSPEAALNGLATKILADGTCQNCGRKTAAKTPGISGRIRAIWCCVWEWRNGTWIASCDAAHND